MRRLAGSESAGDSSGFSAFSSCILFNEPDQVRELERLAEVVVGAALLRFFGDVAVAGEDDVRNRARIGAGLQFAAQRGAVHPFDGEVGEDHLRMRLLGAREGSGAVRDDLAVAPVALQDQRDQPRYLRIVFNDEDQFITPNRNGRAAASEDALRSLLRGSRMCSIPHLPTLLLVSVVRSATPRGPTQMSGPPPALADTCA